MDQFVVPQFIDNEDKIFGPITVRQFIILLFAGVVLFVAFRLLELYLFAVSALFIGGGALLFAFVKVRGQTFHYFILNFVQSARRPGLRIWNKTLHQKELQELMKVEKKEIVEDVTKRAVKREHIRQLSLMVNTGGYYQPDLEAAESDIEDLHIG